MRGPTLVPLVALAVAWSVPTMAGPVDTFENAVASALQSVAGSLHTLETAVEDKLSGAEATTDAVGGDFSVYWNIPLEACESSGVHIDLSKYGVIYNKGQTLQGDKVNIWYRPAKFPYLRNGKPVNGGLPMKGDIKGHLESLRTLLSHDLPKNYSGIAVLDFEEYQPLYDLVPEEYKVASKAWVKDQIPSVHPEELEGLTRAVFDAFAAPYWQDALTSSSASFPKALIGYYHFPYCWNWNAPYTSCKPIMQAGNDRLQDVILKTSTVLFPSVYVFKKHGSGYKAYVNTALEETKRVNKKKLPVLPYFWYRYQEENTYLPNATTFSVIARVKSEFDGIVLWGSTKNLYDQPTCSKFKTYLETTLGPALKCIHRLSRQTLKKLVEFSEGRDEKDTEFLMELLSRSICSD